MKATERHDVDYWLKKAANTALQYCDRTEPAYSVGTLINPFEAKADATWAQVLQANIEETAKKAAQLLVRIEMLQRELAGAQEVRETAPAVKVPRPGPYETAEEAEERP